MCSASRLTPVLALLLLLTPGVSVRAAAPEESGPVELPGPPAPLLEVRERSITVKLFGTDTGASQELTLATDPKRTKVTVGEVVEQKQTDAGTTHVRLRTGPGPSRT